MLDFEPRRSRITAVDSRRVRVPATPEYEYEYENVAVGAIRIVPTAHVLLFLNYDC